MVIGTRSNAVQKHATFELRLIMHIACDTILQCGSRLRCFDGRHLRSCTRTGARRTSGGFEDPAQDTFLFEPPGGNGPFFSTAFSRIPQL